MLSWDTASQWTAHCSGAIRSICLDSVPQEEQELRTSIRSPAFTKAVKSERENSYRVMNMAVGCGSDLYDDIMHMRETDFRSGDLVILCTNLEIVPLEEFRKIILRIMIRPSYLTGRMHMGNGLQT